MRVVVGDGVPLVDEARVATHQKLKMVLRQSTQLEHDEKQVDFWREIVAIVQFQILDDVKTGSRLRYDFVINEQ